MAPQGILEHQKSSFRTFESTFEDAKEEVLSFGLRAATLYSASRKSVALKRPTPAVRSRLYRAHSKALSESQEFRLLVARLIHDHRSRDVLLVAFFLQRRLHQLRISGAPERLDRRLNQT